jgi:uncharacterized protein YdeI (YjbR/CyaY-like superfamily)
MSAGRVTERQEIHPEDRAAWRAWLEANHARSESIWLVYWKKASGRQRLTYAEAVEEALCFGWIDAQIMSLDDHRYRQIFSPRKARSTWSALNKRRVAELEARDLLTPAGLAAIALAKENGSWTSIDHVEALEVPPALTRALSVKGERHFAALSPSNRKAFLHFIAMPKGEAARARRLATALTLLEAGETMRDFYFAKDAAKKLADKSAQASRKARSARAEAGAEPVTGARARRRSPR